MTYKKSITLKIQTHIVNHMEIEWISFILKSQHLNHYGADKMEKVKLGKEGNEKIPLLLEYVNNYCNEHGFELDDFTQEGQVHTFILVKREDTTIEE